LSCDGRLAEQVLDARVDGEVRGRDPGDRELADDGVALCVRTIEAIFAGDGAPSLPTVEPTSLPAPTIDGVAAFARIIH